MPKYVTLFSFKGETIKAFMKKPTDRATAVDEAAKSLGGQLESYYWMMGQYDGFAILELPDTAAAARLSLTVSSSDAFTHVETHELFSSDDIIGLVRATKEVNYAAPGRSADYLQHAMP